MSKPNDFTKQRERIPEQGNTIFNCLTNFIIINIIIINKIIKIK